MPEPDEPPTEVTEGYARWGHMVTPRGAEFDPVPPVFAGTDGTIEVAGGSAEITLQPDVARALVRRLQAAINYRQTHGADREGRRSRSC